jgi:oligoribonuclease NrnB/cAMP/cGMP phosphodiesterase (DHH superfamily)
MCGWDYKDVVPVDLLEAADEIIIVDLSLPDEYMAKYASKIIWIDHHSTAINKFYGTLPFKGAVCRTDRAACELVADYFFDSVPRGVLLLGIYDSWRHNDSEEILDFQAGALLANPDVYSIWWEALFTDENIHETLTVGHTVSQFLRMENAKIMYRCAFETTFGGLPVIACNLPIGGSLAYWSVYDKTKHKAMVRFAWTKGKWSISVYSDHDDVHCGELCQKFGGGGHKGAAGCTVAELPAGFLR